MSALDCIYHLTFLQLLDMAAFFLAFVYPSNIANSALLSHEHVPKYLSKWRVVRNHLHGN